MTLRLLASALALALTTACLTTPVTQVESLGKGNSQFSLEPSFFTLAADSSVGGGRAFVPALNLAGAFGVTDRFDLGARVGGSLYEVHAKLQLTPDGATIPVSIAPYGTFAAIGVGGAGAGYANLKVPVLLGFPIGERSQLVVGPSLSALSAGGGTTDANTGGAVFSVGMALGLHAKINDSFALHPEVGATVPFAFTTEAGSGSGDYGLTSFAFTLGLQFGTTK